jgi:hypothetical protein
MNVNYDIPFSNQLRRDRTAGPAVAAMMVPTIVGFIKQPQNAKKYDRNDCHSMKDCNDGRLEE